MISSIIFKPEFFEIENEFIEKYNFQNSKNYKDLNIGIHEGMKNIRDSVNSANKIQNKNILGISKGNITEQLIDVVYSKNPNSKIPKRIINDIKEKYIGEIFGVIFLNTDSYPESSLYQYLNKKKGSMRVDTPEEATGIRKDALMTYLEKKYGYKTGDELPSSWGNIGCFFHIPNSQNETKEIYSLLEESGSIIKNKLYYS